MPREYRTPAGPAAPNPASFGSSELNLSSPRFVAQTAVAPKENPFEVLQRILGIGTDIGSQMIRMQTAEIEGKINYDRAVEAQKERQEALSKRSEQEAADKWLAEQQLALAKAGTPEEAKAIGEQALKAAPDGATTAQKKASAAVTEQSESEARQMIAEKDRIKNQEASELVKAARSIEVSSRNRIEAAVEAGNIEQLTALRDSFILGAEKSANPEETAAYVGLRAIANAEIEKLNGRLDQENTKKENAAAAEAARLFADAASSVVDDLRANIPDLEKSLEDVTDDSVRNALVDTVRDKILQDNPQLAGIVASGSEAESRAISTAINRSVDTVVDQIVAIRNVRNRQEAFEAKRGDYVERIKTDIKILDEISLDQYLTDAQRNIVFRDTVTSYIMSGETHADDIRLAVSLLKHPERAVATAADAALKTKLDEVSSVMALERRSIIQTIPNTGDVVSAGGWDMKFNTQEEFKDWVLGRIGTTREAFEANSDLQFALGPTVTNLVDQYNKDAAKTELEKRRLDARAGAATKAGRSTMKVADGWKYSPINMAIEDGSYVDIPQRQLYGMLHDSLVNYADVSVPSSLAKVVIEGAADPKNFGIVRQFWRIMNSSVDPTARNAMLDSESYRTSFAIGAALDYMEYDKENSGPTIEKTVVDFAANLRAYQTPEKGTAGDTARRNSVNNTIIALAQGVGLETAWYDQFGMPAKDAFGTMSAADRQQMFMFATMAANFPNAGNAPQLMTDMMSRLGYRVYSYTSQGKNQYSLVQNVPGRLGTTPLPEPAVLDTSVWRSYLESKKPAIAKALTETRQLDNTTNRNMVFSPNSIGAVEISVFDQDLIDGFVTVRAWVENRWINIDSVRVTKEDFETFASESRNKAIDSARKLSGNNPWISDSYEHLVK